jgi:hypothetical protein
MNSEPNAPVKNAGAAKKKPCDYDSDGNPLWDMEAIVGHRLHGGHEQYQVKWKDFPSTQNTWEPYSSFVESPACEAMLINYIQRHVPADLRPRCRQRLAAGSTKGELRKKARNKGT